MVKLDVSFENIVSVDSEIQAGAEKTKTKSRQTSELKSENYISEIDHEKSAEEIQTFIEYFNLATGDKNQKKDNE